MSGHRVTPYEVTATRKHVKNEQEKGKPLLLASIAKDEALDLLDAVENHLLAVEPMVSADKSRTLLPIRALRSGDGVGMVFATDITGEREVVHDGTLPTRPVRFTKGKTDVTRFYSCSLLWRPPGGTRGLLLVHSPWSRGGSRNHILTLLQRAVDSEPAAKAKVRADAIIPASVLRRIVRNANATKITYAKQKRITSTFAKAATSSTSTQAEMDLVVKGSMTAPYRDALSNALRATANKDKDTLFTIRVGEGDEAREETFDDVTVEFETATGSKRYSMRDESIPTASYDQTSKINAIYFGLPENAVTWPDELLRDVIPLLTGIADEVRSEM